MRPRFSDLQVQFYHKSYNFDNGTKMYYYKLYSFTKFFFQKSKSLKITLETDKCLSLIFLKKISQSSG